MNNLTEDMEKSGYLPPTDSRFRADQKDFELGLMAEADE